jgi:hypothetical protein
MMKRQDVINALVNQLRNISKTGGFLTDIGNNVESFYEYEIDEDSDLPLINVRETESTVDLILQGLWRHSCNIEISIVDTGTIEYIRQCVNDILKAVKSDKTIGGTCVLASPGSIKIDKSEEKNKTFVAAAVIVVLQYNSPEWEI